MASRLTSSTTVAAGLIDERQTTVYYWWLLLAIFFEYARPGAFVPGLETIKINTLIPISLLLITLFGKGMRPFSQIYSDRYAKWLTFYLGLVVLSVPIADVTLYSFNIFKKVLGYYFLFIIIARLVTSPRRVRGVFATLIVSHLFLLVMNPEVVLNPSVRSYIRGGTFLGDGNDFSLSLCILLPMAIELARSARSKVMAMMCWAGLVLLVMAIVGTQSRGASLAMGGVFFFLWLNSKRKLASLAAFAVVGLGVALYASHAYFERMSSISNYEQDGSAEGRILAWKAGVRMAVDHPLLGVGTGHFPVAYGSKYMRHDLGNMPWLTAHSMYFLVLGEMGLPGIITLCVLVFGGAIAAMATRRRVLVPITGPPAANAPEMTRLLLLLTASYVGFAIAGAFLSVAYYPHIFVLTALSLSARCISDGAGAEQETARARRPGTAVRRPGVDGVARA